MLRPPELVSHSRIGRLAQRIAERFHPEQIILFGSYAYGKPRPDSEVDLLVVMPTDDQGLEEERIEKAVRPRFLAGFASMQAWGTPLETQPRGLLSARGGHEG